MGEEETKGVDARGEAGRRHRVEKIKEKDKDRSRRRYKQKRQERGLATCGGPVGSHTSVST